MRLTFFLFVFLLPVALCAQTVIRGKVSNKNTEMVPFAQVILYSLPDSTVMAAELTDSAGTFNINIPAIEKTLLLRVATIGYEQ